MSWWWCIPNTGDVTIPVVHSSVGYAFLSNLPSVGAVELNATGSFWSPAAVKQMDVWVATTADSPPHHAAGSPWQQLQSAYVRLRSGGHGCVAFFNTGNCMLSKNMWEYSAL